MRGGSRPTEAYKEINGVTAAKRGITQGSLINTSLVATESKSMIKRQTIRRQKTQWTQAPEGRDSTSKCKIKDNTHIPISRTLWGFRRVLE